MGLAGSIIRPTTRDVVDVLRDAGRLPWDGGGLGGIALPAIDTTRVPVFDGSSHTGTLANTAGNGDVATGALGQSTQFWTFFGRFRPYTLGGLSTLFAVADGTTNRSAVVCGPTTGGAQGRIRALFGAATPGTTFPSNKYTDASHLAVDVESSVCVVVDLSAGTQAARCTIYVDGKVVASSVNGSIPGSIATNAVPFTLGQATGVATTSALPFHGRIRDVRAFIGKACSAAEVATLHAGGAVTGETSRWTLDGVWTDSVGATDLTPTPVAPAGPEFIPLAETFAPAGSFRVGSIADSIWRGSPLLVGYMRAQVQLRLYHLHGGKRVNFVGQYSDYPYPSMVDLEHGGLSDREIGSATTDQVPVNSARYEVANGWLGTYPCDALILGVVTNDITDGTTGAACLTRMGALIDEVRAIDASVPIGVWTPPRLSNGAGGAAATDTERAAYTAGLPALVATKTAVTVLSTEEEQGSIRGLASGDNVHPGRAMAEKMAKPIATWLAGLVP